eukprot:NODE_545_length_1486_cov_445.815514.p1 GENE.NODE_545_length_1486_cov_445.815514~~NODE_545_length_1486_cov_445.815514.p1  ORF type:complete len:428 (-),score=147.61 NODE_545_length_1486_cov_445.815514:186-1349(-)
MVSHCWDEAMDVFLLDVLSMTHNVQRGGMFICFLSVYQGTFDEVNLQVTQGSTNASAGCFAQVLHTVSHNHGYMLVVSNAAVRGGGGGLYSRLWCVWEVYCAVRDGVPLVLHPRTRTEEYLYGERGHEQFDPEKARCGKPGSKPTADEISIRHTIGTTSEWAQIKNEIMNASLDRYGNLSSDTLDASKTVLGNRSMELLVEAMKEDPCAYKALRFTECDLGDRAAEALAEALKTNKTLEWLLLQGNNIGDDGAKALAEALKSNDTLKKLFLDNNCIGSYGAKALAEALKSNDTLEKLYLGRNRIGSDGAEALAEALKSNDTLKTLFLGNNCIGSYGAKALAEALKTNKTLQILDLRSNRIGSNGAEALRDVWKDTNRRGSLSLQFQT